MLNSRPGGRSEVREDLPVFNLSVFINSGGGVYYMQTAGLVTSETQAAAFDNKGPRWISGFRLMADQPVPAIRSLSVEPCVSLDDGATYTPVGNLGVVLSDQRRGEALLPPNSLFLLPDKALVVYRLTLTKNWKGFLTSTLYLY